MISRLLLIAMSMLSIPLTTPLSFGLLLCRSGASCPSQRVKLVNARMRRLEEKTFFAWLLTVQATTSVTTVILLCS